jgi:hypothetical protein
MVLVISSELGAQALKSAMPIEPERSDRPSGNRCSLSKRLRLQREALYRLTLPGREFAEGEIEHLGVIFVRDCFLRMIV